MAWYGIASGSEQRQRHTHTEKKLLPEEGEDDPNGKYGSEKKKKANRYDKFTRYSRLSESLNSDDNAAGRNVPGD